MKPHLLITILFISVLLLSSCSIGYEFVIVNKSDSIIEVQYKTKRCVAGGPEGYNLGFPARLSIEEFQKSKHTWEQLPKEDYKYDSFNCIYTIRVLPSQVLKTQHVSNYPGHKSEDSNIYFGLETVTIKGATGILRLQGEQAKTAFKKESESYILTYE
jgi:hypothetical protein